MAVKNHVKNKTAAARGKQRVPEKSEQMILMRDEASQSLVIVSADDVLSSNKASKLSAGIKIVCESGSDEPVFGPILAIGTQLECSKAMSTIKKTLGNTTDDTTKTVESQPLQSTITIESHPVQSTITVESQPAQSTITVEQNISKENHVNEDESSDTNISTLYIVDEEETEENISSVSIAASTNSRGEKRSHDENSTNLDNRKKHSRGSLSVPYSTFSEKAKECLSLQAQITYFQEEWMPRPKDPKVIKYLIEITNILSGSNGNPDEDTGEILEGIIRDLKMNEKELQFCHGRSATITARRIMKFKYPNPANDLKIKKIDESILTSIIRYTRISNPSDKVSETNIRHAMSNYVTVQKFKNKTSSIAKSNDVFSAYALACYNISENDETCLPNQHTLEHKIDDDEETKSETSSPDFEDLLEMDVSSDTSDEFSEHDSMEEDNMEVDETRFEYDDFMPETGITPNIIACLLVMFKRRHRLSIQCISDLLKLLSILGVDSAPRSWYMLKRLITKIGVAPSYHYPCSSCSAASTCSRKCSNCVKDQVDIILSNNADIDLFSSSLNNHISDIKYGNFYHQLSNICPDKFITFTMNVDGVEVKKGSKQSIWPMLLVVNELPINRRNAFENVIIAGIWSGSHKPSREQMQCFLAPVVEQLSLLEHGYPFFDYQNSERLQNTIIKVFLIAACCDKSAQALVQNIAEPIAAFGCGRCELDSIKRLLKLWFDRKYSSQNWSIANNINELSSSFLQLRLPSTTSRL
ncbi:unnamed protein product [Rotaria magnacalcarata]|uniref:Uncharacterized protein n=1 Tax=Rotaria magnacalcarata TaxID=392030 RepID=A0A8S2NEV8_9BILA|nr:unnamed protein product [Rotaria magnacalcarata]